MEDAIQDFNRRFAELTPEQQEQVKLIIDSTLDALSKPKQPHFQSGGKAAGPKIELGNVGYIKQPKWLLKSDIVLEKIEELERLRVAKSMP